MHAVDLAAALAGLEGRPRPSGKRWVLRRFPTTPLRPGIFERDSEREGRGALHGQRLRGLAAQLREGVAE